MAELINAIAQCLVTGLSTAVCITIFAHLGWLPMIIVAAVDKQDEEA